MSRLSGALDQPTGLIIVCERIITDEDTKRRSLIDVFDNLTGPQLPFSMPRLSVYVALSQRQVGPSTVNIAIFTPTGVPLVEGVINVSDWRSDHLEIPLTFDGLEFDQEGDYVVRAWLADESQEVIAEKRIAVRSSHSDPESESG